MESGETTEQMVMATNRFFKKDAANLVFLQNMHRFQHINLKL
jgi:hypothetical protein